MPASPEARDTTPSGFDIPPIQSISGEAPWRWLRAGWRDLTRHPFLSLGYGLFFTVALWVLAAILIAADRLFLLLPLALGLVFMGPLLAVGLHEISRRAEAGLPVTLWTIALVRTRAPLQIAFMGLALVLFMLAWIRIATLLFALFFGAVDAPLAEAIVTLHGLIFLALGTTIGAGLAFAVFCFSAITIPRLMVRDIDVISAIATSVNAVRTNFWPMLLWAWLIGILTAFGVVTLTVGLIVIFPLLGHATWHSYRDLVPDRIDESF